MKKLLFFLVASFVMGITITAQVTQEQADGIVLEIMSEETRLYKIFAKNEIQPAGTIITTTAGEIIQIEYSGWIYFVKYTDLPQSFYIIVKTTNGNLLEVNLKNDEGPQGYEEWRNVNYPVKIPITHYSLSLSTCQWKNLNFNNEVIIINSIETLENYIDCIDGDYPEVDFAKNSLFLVSGIADYEVSWIDKSLQQLTAKTFNLNMDITQIGLPDPSIWTTAFTTRKINAEKIVNVNSIFIPPCNCIIDTLKGEWNWYKWYNWGHPIVNNFKSILKVSSLNEDNTVNYEFLVEDTLFYEGNFSYQYSTNQSDHFFAKMFIKVPNWDCFFDKDVWLVILAAPNFDNLVFLKELDDCPWYYYKKNK